MSTQPVRTCVGCRKRTARAELLRVVVDVRDGGLEVVPDPKRSAPGRGAHLHPTPHCLELALRRRAFTRALRAPVGVGGRGLSTTALEAYVQQWAASVTAVENRDAGE